MVGADVVSDRPRARLLDHRDGLAVQPDVFADQFGAWSDEAQVEAVFGDPVAHVVVDIVDLHLILHQPPRR